MGQSKGQSKFPLGGELQWLKIIFKMNIVVCACNPSTWEVEAGGSTTAWATADPVSNPLSSSSSSSSKKKQNKKFFKHMRAARQGNAQKAEQEDVEFEVSLRCDSVCET